MDHNVYVVCDYAATGEGRSVMTLITRARCKYDDYEIPPHFGDEGWNPGVEKNTPEERALLEFKEKFGDYYAIGATILDRFEFFHQYGQHVPEYLYKLCDPESDLVPPGFNWFGSIHMNYS